MTHRDVALGREIVARWCNLAERRLDYLTELFETGRWRRFHSEVQFLQNIQEAKAAVELWRSLETREASLDNTAIDLSWLGRRQSAESHTLLRDRLPPAPAVPLVPVVAESPASDVPTDVLIALESVLAGSAEAPPVSDAPAIDAPVIPVLDLDQIQARYPLLRNAL